MCRMSLCSHRVTVLHSRHVFTDKRNFKTLNTYVLKREVLQTKFYYIVFVMYLLYWSECIQEAEVQTQMCQFSPTLRLHPSASSSKYPLVLWVPRKIHRVHPVAERILAQGVVPNPYFYVALKESVTAYSLCLCVDQGVVNSNSTRNTLLFFISMAECISHSDKRGKYFVKWTQYLGCRIFCEMNTVLRLQDIYNYVLEKTDF